MSAQLIISSISPEKIFFICKCNSNRSIFDAFLSDFLFFPSCRFVSDVHNNDDSHGTVAAQKIRALLQFVKHPAYRLELLTSKVTGRFFCPVNGDVKLGQTPLHFAVSLGKWEAVKALLEDACCLLDGCFTETYDFEVTESPENSKNPEQAENPELHKIPESLKTSEPSPQTRTSDKPKRKKLLEDAMRQLYAGDELPKPKLDILLLQRLRLAYKEQMKRQYSIFWAKDSQGNSVFHLAVIHNQQGMYLKLREYSENLSKLLNDLYFGQQIATENSEKLVGSKFNSFESYDDEFLKNDNGYTPLELAAYLGNILMMRFLLNTFESRNMWTFANKSVVLNKVYRLDAVLFQFQNMPINFFFADQHPRPRHV
jgi:ankyrin repeat protein